MKKKLTKNRYLIYSPLILCFLATSIDGQNLQSNCSDYIEYQVREGDTISSIAHEFGSEKFKELILSANSNVFSENEQLSGGQVLKIPTKIYHFNSSDITLQEVLSNPLCNPEQSGKEEFTFNLEELEQKQASDTSDTKALEKFREAFETLVEEERDTVQEEEQAKAEQQLFLELDGLVMDETRSKIGRDFYNIFYQKWEAPPNSSNYTITISEKPTPTLGSFISVSVNDQQTFQYRLQPRYEIIQQVADYAVQVTYVYMRDNKHQYIIY